MGAAGRKSDCDLETDRSLFCPQFLVSEEKKVEEAAPPVEDTGDVDDLVRVSVISGFKYLSELPQTLA